MLPAIIARSVHTLRQIEIHTTETLVPEPSPFEFKVGTATLKKYKSPGSDQIPVELIQAGGKTLHSEILKLITYRWSNEKN
jgi:hypothetical protein